MTKHATGTGCFTSFVLPFFSFFLGGGGGGGLCQIIVCLSLVDGKFAEHLLIALALSLQKKRSVSISAVFVLILYIRLTDRRGTSGL